jgi:transcriptional regulator with XRE-family HTH domain
MTLGEKIKSVRIKKKITQEHLCGNKITRNMLSAIERGKASPSLDTLYYLASRLSIPVSYLVSQDDDLFYYEKQASTKQIYSLYSAGKFRQCTELIESLSSRDDELNYILADSYFEAGRAAVLSGSIFSAKRYITRSRECCAATALNTSYIEARLLLYSALADNIQAPLLELDSAAFDSHLLRDFDYELYRYMLGDSEFDYKTPVYKMHVSAKSLMRERKYPEALAMLNSVVRERNADTYNAYVMFSVYTDMEACSKQLLDYEGAYKYASKRLSMLEGFKA